MRRGALAGSLLFIVVSGPAWAWMRVMPDWKATLAEPEAIVVGRLVANPIHVEHRRGPDEGRSWEYHARLAIDEVLRGELEATEVPIVLHYGLSPSRYVEDGALADHSLEEHPGQAIYDSGSFAVPPRPIMENADEPGIWLLGHYEDRFGRADAPTEWLGVRDPEHLWPIEFLPFFRAILQPDAVDEQLAFLHDPDERVRKECLRYFIDHQQRRAFPAVADLLTDERLGGIAVEACRVCGGEAALPHLRSLLADETREVFDSAARALAKLKDSASLPRLAEVAQAGRTPGGRGSAVWALGQLGDPAAMPTLLAALKADAVIPGPPGDELWERAQRSIEELTGCTLSPNGEKAVRWWEAAQHRDRAAWQHFEAAQRIEALLAAGPDRQDRSDMMLTQLAGRRPAERLLLDFMRQKQYDPVAGQRLWRQWLAEQGWTDYQDLPSQIDDELVLTVEQTASLESAEPARLRYTVTNRSDHDVWLTKHCYELAYIIYENGNASLGSEGEYDRPQELTAEDFFRLPAGQARTTVGKNVFRHPDRHLTSPPAIIAAGLVFDRKGTSLGLDAWAGEVWAEPMRVK
jgi:hypothetical protein